MLKIVHKLSKIACRTVLKPPTAYGALSKIAYGLLKIPI